jgi:hypothetical protein
VFVDGDLLAVKLIREGLAYETVSHYGDNGYPKIGEAILRAAEETPAPPFEPPYLWRQEHRTEPVGTTTEYRHAGTAISQEPDQVRRGERPRWKSPRSKRLFGEWTRSSPAPIRGSSVRPEHVLERPAYRDRALTDEDRLLPELFSIASDAF